MVVIMEIIINIRDVYGNAVAYPVCEKAKLFANLCGTKTLTVMALANIARLGYEVVCQPIDYPILHKAAKLRQAVMEQT